LFDIAAVTQVPSLKIEYELSSIQLKILYISYRDILDLCTLCYLLPFQTQVYISFQELFTCQVV